MPILFEAVARLASMPARRTAAPLSRDSILAAAMRIVEERGGDALTLRSLGAALGVNHTAVLRHFTGKDDIVLGLAERLLLEALDGFSPEAHWRATLEGLARRMRSACMAHPSVAALSTTRVSRTPAELRGADLVIRALRDAGLEPPAAAVVYRSVVDLAFAISTYQAASAALDPGLRSADSEAWRREYLAASPAAYPALAEAAPYLAGIDDDAVFEASLSLVLDGVAARLG